MLLHYQVFRFLILSPLFVHHLFLLLLVFYLNLGYVHSLILSFYLLGFLGLFFKSLARILSLDVISLCVLFLIKIPLHSFIGFSLCILLNLFLFPVINLVCVVFVVRFWVVLRLVVFLIRNFFTSSVAFPVIRHLLMI